MGDFPIYEALLCELLLGVTVVPLCARLPRMRRDFGSGTSNLEPDPEGQAICQTAHQRLGWLPIYPLVMRELQKRGEDLRSELPLVLMLLCDDRPEPRHRGWRMLQDFFPDLAKKIPDYDAWQTAAECRARADSIRPVSA